MKSLREEHHIQHARVSFIRTSIAKLECTQPRAERVQARVAHVGIARVAVYGEVREACGRDVRGVGAVVRQGVLAHIPAAVNAAALQAHPLLRRRCAAASGAACSRQHVRAGCEERRVDEAHRGVVEVRAAHELDRAAVVCIVLVLLQPRDGEVDVCGAVECLNGAVGQVRSVAKILY